MNNPLQPSASLLSKLGSIVVHLEELNGPGAHHFDKVAMDQLLNDPEVREWVKQMDSMAMLPRKRTAEDLRLNIAKETKAKRKKQS